MLNNYKLAHMGYIVEDLDSSLNKFINEGAKVLIEPSEETIQNVLVALIEIEDNIQIELVAAIDINNSPIKARLLKGGGLDHICYEVTDLNLALEQEKLKGAKIICSKTPAKVFKGYNLAFVYRRSGLIVELLEKL